MKKQLVILGIAVLLICVGLSGCFDDIEDGCTVVTARELYEDMSYNLTGDISNQTFNLSYNSFLEGDCIIIHDNISIIKYYPEENHTSVCFSWYEDPYTKPHVYYHFEGNITDTYQEGDLVEIKLHIKHVDIIVQFMTYHVDVFEEQWASKQYFIDNVQSVLIDEGLKAMDTSVITKV